MVAKLEKPEHIQQTTRKRIHVVYLYAAIIQRTEDGIPAMMGSREDT